MPTAKTQPRTLSRRKPRKAAAVATEAEGAPDVPGAITVLAGDPLDLFHPVTAAWFRAVFDGVTPPQREGWPAIAHGDSTLILAPTGTGKTLSAFLWCLDRLMLQRPAHYDAEPGCRVLYLSPLKALAVDVERNLRSPLQGIANMAGREGVAVHLPEISVRTGDTSQRDRARFKRHPGEILITTPESLYLLLTSDAGESLRTVETVIIDEIHALVPTKRGAHVALSLERLEALCGRPLQRIGLSATQRPLEEVARFLGGAQAQLPTSGVPASSSAEVSSTETASTDTRTAEAITGTTGLTATDDYTSAEAAESDPKDNASTSGPRFRPVTIVNAGARKRLEIRVEVPVEDMAKLGEIQDLPCEAGPLGRAPSAPASGSRSTRGCWRSSANAPRR